MRPRETKDSLKWEKDNIKKRKKMIKNKFQLHHSTAEQEKCHKFVLYDGPLTH